MNTIHNKKWINKEFWPKVLVEIMSELSVLVHFRGILCYLEADQTICHFITVFEIVHTYDGTNFSIHR